jgi:hypothetical protein
MKGPTCRKLDKRSNRCPNPELSDVGLCFKHLREAHDEWRRILTDEVPAHLAATFLGDTPAAA